MVSFEEKEIELADDLDNAIHEITKFPSSRFD